MIAGAFQRRLLMFPFLHTKEEDVTRVKKMCTTFYLQTRFDSLLAKEGFNGISKCMNRRDETDS